jgi:hypothetical protein
MKNMLKYIMKRVLLIGCKNMGIKGIFTRKVGTVNVILN